MSKKIFNISDIADDKKWYVYMLRCADGSLYTGVTTDVNRRVKEHNGEGAKGRGAKYTKTRQPVELFYSEMTTNRSEAQIREAAIRKLSRTEKMDLEFQKL